jgi:hypothetical protein
VGRVDSSEVELVRRLARGERAAVAALYDRFAVVLHALGARILGDRPERQQRDPGHRVRHPLGAAEVVRAGTCVVNAPGSRHAITVKDDGDCICAVRTSGGIVLV